MRRNLLSLKPARKPYSELSFPEWVSVTPCKTRSYTLLVPTRYGVIKDIIAKEVN